MLRLSREAVALDQALTEFGLSPHPRLGEALEAHQELVSVAQYVSLLCQENNTTPK